VIVNKVNLSFKKLNNNFILCKKTSFWSHYGKNSNNTPKYKRNRFLYKIMKNKR